jgi:hypothetical protein
MSLAFWNNPLVVTAFRVRYRRGGIFNLTALYLLALVVLGAVLQHYDRELKGNWVRMYYLLLMSVQFGASGLVAGLSTAASLKAELTQRTLDFQRIAALSPRQILVGKLFGEPALAYLLAMASIPLAVLCWLWGGVSLDVMVMMYVQLISTTLLLGCLGLLNRLDGTRGRVTGGQGVGWVILPFVLLFQAAAGGTFLLAIPWVAAIEGLLTPLPSFFGIFRQDPWLYGLPFFGHEIPFLLITPFSQLALAYVCFQTMARQLLNPLNPPFSKGMAYLTLVGIDLLAAAVIYDAGSPRWELNVRAAAFCLVHLCASYLLIQPMTPWREGLQSWVWRYRDRSPRWRDRWLGNRSPNGPALVTFCVIGAASLVFLVLLPEVRLNGTHGLRAAVPVIVAAASTTGILILALGTLLQWGMFLAGRAGAGTTFTVLSVAVALPHVLGAYYHHDWLLAISPSAQFGNWLFELPQGPPLDLMPLIVLYGTLLFLVWMSLHRRLFHLSRVVHAKLERMGVFEAPAGGSHGQAVGELG